MLAIGKTLGQAQAAPATGHHHDVGETPFMTELFLDNQILEVTPGVSRRLHQPKKHLLNPVVRCDRWCEGNYIRALHHDV